MKPLRCAALTALAIALPAATAAAATSTVAPTVLRTPGSYRTASGSLIYVGPEGYLPDPAYDEFLDPDTGRIGEVPKGESATLVAGIGEERRVVHSQLGALGVSLWYAGNAPRATVILIHGNDPETRDMGALVPYFVVNGVNVITYDQRGTGDSPGNWFLSGPPQRATDVEAIYDAFQTDPHVDVKRTGLWAASNGGWTAPIVATKRPVAFMILKSAPAESLEDNILFEVGQQLHRKGYDGAMTQARQTWRVMIAALKGEDSWNAACEAYASANKAPWFAASLLPAKLPCPMPPQLAGGFRHAVDYDPASTLLQVRTPTLALFGANDRNVDAPHAAKTFRASFTRAGMRDFTVRVFPGASHTLMLSKSGYIGDDDPPARFAPGYPAVMLDWLRTRGFTF